MPNGTPTQKDVEILVITQAPVSPWRWHQVPGAKVDMVSFDAGSPVGDQLLRLTSKYRGNVNAIIFDLWDYSTFVDGMFLALLEALDPDLCIVVTASDTPRLNCLGNQTQIDAADHGYLFQWEFTAHIEAYSAPIIGTAVVGAYAKRRSGLKELVTETGPMLDGVFKMWSKEPFRERGVAVPALSDQVTNYLYEAHLGKQPMWARPGFPILIPEQSFTFRDFDANDVEGVLCDKENGEFVVLEAADLLEIMGYPKNALPAEPQWLQWMQMRGLLPVDFANAILRFCVEDGMRHPLGASDAS